MTCPFQSVSWKLSIRRHRNRFYHKDNKPNTSVELHHGLVWCKKKNYLFSKESVERYSLGGQALVKIRPLFTVSKRELRSLFSLPDKHVVLVGELKMPACGRCMAAYKKAALVVKTVCLHKSFTNLHPFLFVLLSHSFSQSSSPPLNLLETQNLFCSLC